MKAFRYPKEMGKVYLVSSGLDMDFLRIILDHYKEDFWYLNVLPENFETVKKCSFILLDERIVGEKEIPRLIEILKNPYSTLFVHYTFQVDQSEHQRIDLSPEYEIPFRVLADATVRKAYRKNLFFSSENGIWDLVRTEFCFPHSSQTLEVEFIRSISSSRDILVCYDRVKNFAVVRIT